MFASDIHDSPTLPCVQAMELCNKCSIFTTDIWQEKFPAERWRRDPSFGDGLGDLVYRFPHSKLSEFRCLAALSCKLCHMMLDSAISDAIARSRGAAEIMEAPDEAVYIRVRSSVSEAWIFYIEVPLSKPINGASNMVERFELYDVGLSVPANTSNLDPHQAPSIRAHISDEADCETVFKLAQYWISCCRRDHPYCMESRRKSLPPRIIYVGCSESNPEVYLLDGAGRTGEYLTLSHCWGVKMYGLTTQQNVAERRHGISIGSLPKTFRDAIHITRALGFDYLWIDSLCIIQDSPGDWKLNCPKMSTIYAQSTITISSLFMKNRSDGILSDRKQHFPQNTSQPLKLSSHPDERLRKLAVRVAAPNLYYSMVNSELNTRGWILQERLLSPAILYFGSSQIFWECQRSTASESRPVPLRQGEKYLKNMLFEIQREGVINHEQAHFTAWYLVIEAYTRKRLTFASDRPAAILGISKKFQSLYAVDYAAGLWLEDLHRGLLWMRSPCGKGDEHNHRTPGSAPSWSWLSVQHPILFAHLPSLEHLLAFPYYPITRIVSPADPEIIDIVNNSRRDRDGCIQLWANLLNAFYTPLREYKGNYFGGLQRTCSLNQTDATQLRCVLDFDVKHGERVYCARLGTWDHDLGSRMVQGIGNCHHLVRTYYLVLRRARSTRKLLRPEDRGSFHRIGIGSSEVSIVDSFFANSSRCFLRLN